MILFIQYSTFSPISGALLKVIDRFLPHVGQLLSQKGRLYLLLLEENKPGEFILFCFKVASLLNTSMYH